ncbi:hypothetical protein J4731_09150 [Providencia rettgeri]|nr:hypothetical protein [Providencia rettgeri]
MLTHKQQTVEWMADVAKRAKEQNKTLITFSHFPMVEFDNGAADDLETIFGKGKFQLERAPKKTLAMQWQKQVSVFMLAVICILMIQCT